MTPIAGWRPDNETSGKPYKLPFELRRLNAPLNWNIIAVLTRAQASDVVFMLDASCCNSVDNYFLQVILFNNSFINNNLYFH